EILSTLTNSVNMIPCGEDLGANLPCLPSVMQKNGILALRVLRWCRNWNNEPVKPYIPMNQLTELSVATSSVHDSPTLRQWWNQDKEAVSLIVKTYPESFGAEGWDSQKIEKIANEPFNQEKALQYLVLASKANSVWCIHPMQDFLSTEQKYWLSNPDEERINIPGTVSKFNWTYRLPAFIEEIAKDENLINKIKTITSAHK
ncbi:MAG: 4-alpha-glucanotransferase, partial [Treponema sp.]|nr:4-alpha-glucanotransferase [Treponema sp.]